MRYLLQTCLILSSHLPVHTCSNDMAPKVRDFLFIVLSPSKKVLKMKNVVVKLKNRRMSRRTYTLLLQNRVVFYLNPHRHIILS